MATPSTIPFIFTVTAPGAEADKPIAISGLLNRSQRNSMTAVPNQRLGVQAIGATIYALNTPINVYDTDDLTDREDDFRQVPLDDRGLTVTGEDILDQLFVRSSGNAAKFTVVVSVVVKG